MSKNEKDNDDLLKEINKLFGQKKVKSNFQLLSSRDTVERLSFGLEELNKITGGGLPRGLITELYGEEASGKTYLLLKSYAAAQEKGLVCAHFDVEQSFNPEWAEKNGVNLSALLYDNEIQSAENIFKKVELLCSTDRVALIGIDSTAALQSQRMLDADYGDEQMAVLARALSSSLRKLVSVVKKHNVALVFINQVRTNVGQMWGNNTVTPGGKALKFYSSLRILVKKRNPKKSENPEFYEKVNGREIPIGHFLECDISKNRTAAPNGFCSVPLMYKPKNKIFLLLEEAIENEIISKNKSNHKKFVYEEHKIDLQNKNDLEELLKWFIDNCLIEELIEEKMKKNFNDYIEDIESYSCDIEEDTEGNEEENEE